MPYNVLQSIFKLSDSYQAATGLTTGRAGLRDSLTALQAAVEQVGRNTTGAVGPAIGGEIGANHDRNRVALDHESSAELERLADEGWRTVVATAPVDAYRFQVTYGAELAHARAPLTHSDSAGGGIPQPVGAIWETPVQLSRLVADFLSGRPPRNQDEKRAERVAGRLGVLALTLVTLQDADERRDIDIAVRPSEDEAVVQAQAAAHRRDVAMRLLALRPVREALATLYSPQVPKRFQPPPAPMEGLEGPDSSASLDEEHYQEYKRFERNRKIWTSFPFARLEFLEFGTTSVVLRTRPSVSKPEPRVLKCVLLPYARIPAVAEATSSYYETYGDLALAHGGADDAVLTVPRPVVQVEASSPNWIIMDEVQGKTLHDLLRVPSARPGERERKRDTYSQRLIPRGLRRTGAPLRLDLLREVMPALLNALDFLYRARPAGSTDNDKTPPLCHADLNPKNIMVLEGRTAADRRVYHITLIDLGRNHLLGRSPTGRQRTDELYTAPELPLGHPPDTFADLYSIGQILIGMCGVGRGPEGTVPDALYAVTPVLARLAEDLIDPDPGRRLRLFSSVRRRTTAPPAKTVAPRLQADSGETGTPPDTTAETNPFSLRRLRATLNQELDALERSESKSGMLVDVAQLRVALLILSPLSQAPGRLRRLYRCREEQSADLGREEGVAPRPDEHVQWLTAWAWASAVCWVVSLAVLALLTLSDAGVPLPWPSPIASAQHSADFPDRLGARLTGFTFALCAVKYYQNIYAGLTVRWTWRPSAIARWAEFWVRANALTVGLLVIPVNLFAPHLWTLASALGITSAFFVNRSGYAYAKSVVESADGSLIASRPGDIPGLAMYKAWGPSMLCYVLIVWMFAVFLNTYVLKDVLAYASVVSGINLALFYLLKCAIDATPVRVALTRCYLAAERLHLRSDGATVPPDSSTAETTSGSCS